MGSLGGKIMMKLGSSTNEENVLSALSETLNLSITLRELLKETRRSENVKIQVALNELFTLNQTTKMYYFFLKDKDKDVEVLTFFTVFDEYYFEVKHNFLYETNLYRRDFKQADARLLELKDAFSKIVEKNIFGA
jgi:hypothetical protein